MKSYPYGSWSSPISAELVASSFVSFGELCADGEDLYYLESRPADRGRTVLMVTSDTGDHREVTSNKFDVRTMVHEYGGGSYTVANGNVFFVNKDDQNVYHIAPDQTEPRKITDSSRDERFADFAIDSQGDLICIREKHQSDREPRNDLVRIRSSNGEIDVLHEGHDFYSSPRLSPNFKRIAFLAWDHPNMPWDGTQLYQADVSEANGLNNLTMIAGGTDESVVQPTWIGDERLAFVSDQSGFWNIYIHELGGAYCVANDDAEYGFPHWVFALRTIVSMTDSILLAVRSSESGPALVYVDSSTQLVSPCNEDFSSYASLTKYGGGVAFIAGKNDDLSAIVQLAPRENELQVVRTQGVLPFAKSYVSQVHPIRYLNAKGQDVYANFYAPTNPDVVAPSGERPPLLVLSHGGPTSNSNTNFSFLVQYFATRGWAVLDVNYGGSTGYGRQYRNRLIGEWGNVDVEDCVAGVRHLVSQDLVDPSRVAIRGGSAGGYTTLRALTTSNVFKAGASYYGVADVRALVDDTHKFESRYIEALVPSDEIDARSPIHHIDHLDSPVVFYQGTEDAIVPPNQSQMMFDSLAAKGIATALFLFEHEGHGFRISENIRDALESEFVFFSRVFGIDPHGLTTECFSRADVANASWD
ncbi:MAG: prolyl oligopeptidase family serine peptidase [Gammaproteobacteria bacterium]|nr:prolyl oligopeptidase family serine peptidase [Gammaproteobacteria bacterium]